MRPFQECVCLDLLLSYPEANLFADTYSVQYFTMISDCAKEFQCLDFLSLFTCFVCVLKYSFVYCLDVRRD